MNKKFKRKVRNFTSLHLVLIVLSLILIGTGTALACNHYLSSPASRAQDDPQKMTAQAANFPPASTPALTPALTPPSTPSSPAVDQPSQKVTTRVPVLYYHSIMVETGNELRVPPEEFAAQMSYLSQKGYQVITLDQLYNAFYKKGSLPDKPIAITFDDGYRDNFTNAQPIKYIAYPFGGYNSSTMKLAKTDGYVAGFTTEKGWAQKKIDPYSIQRIYCYANMGLQEFERRITHPDY